MFKFNLHYLIHTSPHPTLSFSTSYVSAASIFQKSGEVEAAPADFTASANRTSIHPLACRGAARERAR